MKGAIIIQATNILLHHNYFLFHFPHCFILALSLLILNTSKVEVPLYKLLKDSFYQDEYPQKVLLSVYVY